MAKVNSWFRRLAIVALMGVASLHAGPALVDINSATVQELMTLPGVRDAMAQAIVKNRPYSNKGQLVSRKVISPAAYRRIRDSIIARQ